MDPKYLKSLFDSEKEAQEKKERALIELKKHILNFESEGGKLKKLSKEIINEAVYDRFAAANERSKEAEKLIENFQKNLADFKKLTADHIKNSVFQLRDLNNIKLDLLEDNFENAKEEFLEGVLLLKFLSQKQIYQPSAKNLKNFNAYAGALSDFCGELVRRARTEAVERGTEACVSIKKYQEITESIYAALSGYAFSNASGVRPKIEQLKRFLEALGEISYDLNLKKKKINID